MGSSRIWFTSDTHFGHKNILKYEPHRVKELGIGSIEEHDLAIINLYNKLVKSEDIVYHLGDIGVDRAIGKYIRQLNGTKHLIVGNHDKMSDKQYRIMGFASVSREMTIKLGGRYLRLSHYPYREGMLKAIWRQLFGSPLRDVHKRPINDGKWLLHGHIHSRAKIIPYGKQIHIGVDTWGMMPVSWEQVNSIISKQEKGK